MHNLRLSNQSRSVSLLCELRVARSGSKEMKTNVTRLHVVTLRVHCTKRAGLRSVPVWPDGRMGGIYCFPYRAATMFACTASSAAVSASNLSVKTDAQVTADCERTICAVSLGHNSLIEGPDGAVRSVSAESEHQPAPVGKIWCHHRRHDTICLRKGSGSAPEPKLEPEPERFKPKTGM